MKRFLLLALCALFVGDAGARTLYVDARRPNNDGNGLSKARAKKTIQAAINVAGAGDTILVATGGYSSIRTNNKKIKIKALGGPWNTTIRRSRTRAATWCLDLAKWNGSSCAGGSATGVWGFRCKGNGLKGTAGSGGVVGGIVQECEFVDFQFGARGWDRGKAKKPVFWRTKLVDSVLANCYQNTEFNDLMRSCTVQRCSIANCGSRIRACKLINTFVGGAAMDAGKSWGPGTIPSSEYADYVDRQKVTWCGTNGTATTYGCFFLGSKLYNCTVVYGNSGRFTTFFKKSKAWNTIFWKVPTSVFSRRTALRNSFTNCYEGGSNPGFVQPYGNRGWMSFELDEDSPCVDAGKLTAALRRIVGPNDLWRLGRVHGRRVDMGCFEFN